MKRRAFTLVEMLVVLAVIAIISTLTFGVISNTVESNKKSSCVSNMIQVYGALRLYAQDYDGLMPYFKPDTSALANTVKPQSIDNNLSGLWLLVRYENGTRSGYLRSSAKFQCPADRFQVLGAATPPGSSAYNSYQVQDDIPNVTPKQYTYATFRKDKDKRQLNYFDGSNVNDSRRVSDTTVITWCRYHRSLDSDGKTKSNTNNRDNVLFYDGRVQPLPLEQPVSNGAGAEGSCYGWQRVPLQLQDSLSTPVNNCEFAN